MSRLTGTDAYGLMEAYNNVYAPQELTEEQIWEEVENWVNSLLEEGYDLSEYTWDDMYEMYVTEGPNYDKNRQRAAQRAAARNAARKEGKTGNVPGVGYVTPRPERETYRDAAGVERHTSGAKMPKKEDQKESFDLFDTILEHLVAEGYADTNESALVIMANMSEEWRESIVEGLVGNIVKAVPAVVKAVKNAPKAVDNTMKYYEKNPEQALPFLAPALAASGNRARQASQERNQKK